MDSSNYHRKTSSEYDGSQQFPMSSSIQEDMSVDYYSNNYSTELNDLEVPQHLYSSKPQYNYNPYLRNDDYRRDENDYMYQDAGLFGDNLNLDLPEVAHMNMHDTMGIHNNMNLPQQSYIGGYSGGDSFRGHRNAYSMLSSGSDLSFRRYDTPYNNSRTYSQGPEFSSLLSEPPLQGDLDLPSYLGNNQPFYYQESNHSRMRSSPPMQNSPLPMDIPYHHYGYSMTAVPGMHSHQSSGLTDDYSILLPHDRLDKQQQSTSPLSKEMQQSRESSCTPREHPVKKLPYACRDFRNGYCSRGENCKFMHVLESPSHGDTLKQKNTQICRDFLRGQCQRKNCKFLHKYPEVPLSLQNPVPRPYQTNYGHQNKKETNKYQHSRGYMPEANEVMDEPSLSYTPKSVKTINQFSGKHLNQNGNRSNHAFKEDSIEEQNKNMHVKSISELDSKNGDIDENVKNLQIRN